MKRLKILFVTQYFPAPKSIGSTGGTISNLNFLRTLGEVHDVTVLSFDRTAGPQFFSNERFSVIQRAYPRWRALGLFLHWQKFVRDETENLICDNDTPDILIASTSTLCAFNATSNQTKCIAMVRAFENFGLLCSWVPKATRVKQFKGALLRKFADARLLRSADSIFTNSIFMKKAITSHFGIPNKRLHVLTQQIDFLPAQASAPHRSIGFVHRGADKNIAHVIALARRAPDLSFLIYGHSKEMPVDVPENVSILGWAADRSKMFASARLWLVPSLWAEPFGRVSIEAQAANRAVLVANTGGLPETVMNKHFLIDGFMPEEWLGRIRKLLSLTDAELAEIGKSARLNFSAAAHNESIWAAIEATINSSGTQNDV